MYLRIRLKITIYSNKRWVFVKILYKNDYSPKHFRAIFSFKILYYQQWLYLILFNIYFTEYCSILLAYKAIKIFYYK